MITCETAERIWVCYREIAAGEKLLVDMADVDKPDRFESNLRDAFGRRRQLQLGVPSGETGHRLFGVDPELAKAVIRAHIANKTAELASANEAARIELAVAAAEGGGDNGTDL